MIGYHMRKRFLLLGICRHLEKRNRGRRKERGKREKNRKRGRRVERK